ncbi:hypothetical protein CoNPh26_CDS0096 [Staphylococcus phage S-CoN_Ph26]|nr:hypothetical protein CoNPh26_CDS0096 [Staphylococcus phage S-CoN_Ph26]
MYVLPIIVRDVLFRLVRRLCICNFVLLSILAITLQIVIIPFVYLFLVN